MSIDCLDYKEERRVRASNNLISNQNKVNCIIVWIKVRIHRFGYDFHEIFAMKKLGANKKRPISKHEAFEVFY